MARKETTNGDLRTLLTFYTAKVAEGLDGRDVAKVPVFMAMGEVYQPSLKDLEIASGKGVQARLTVKIRDPLSAYVPKSSDLVEVSDGRVDGEIWSILDIRPDFHQRDFLVMVLGGDGHV